VGCLTFFSITHSCFVLPFVYFLQNYLQGFRTTCRCDDAGNCLSQPLQPGNDLSICIFARPGYELRGIESLELVQGDFKEIIVEGGSGDGTDAYDDGSSAVVGMCAGPLCMVKTPISDSFFEAGRAGILSVEGVALVVPSSGQNEGYDNNNDTAEGGSGDDVGGVRGGEGNITAPGGKNTTAEEGMDTATSLPRPDGAATDGAGDATTPGDNNNAAEEGKDTATSRPRPGGGGVRGATGGEGTTTTTSGDKGVNGKSSKGGGSKGTYEFPEEEEEFEEYVFEGDIPLGNSEVGVDTQEDEVPGNDGVNRRRGPILVAWLLPLLLLLLLAAIAIYIYVTRRKENDKNNTDEESSDEDDSSGGGDSSSQG